MIVYVDDNLPSAIAHALHALQSGRVDEEFEVRHVKDHFGEGALDVEWLPVAGAEGATVITQDYNIRRTRAEQEICDEFGLVIIFLKPPSKSRFLYWDLVALIVKHWAAINKCGLGSRPAAYRITSRASKPEPLD